MEAQPKRFCWSGWAVAHLNDDNGLEIDSIWPTEQLAADRAKSLTEKFGLIYTHQQWQI